jgi:hypothetical protein
LDCSEKPTQNHIFISFWALHFLVWINISSNRAIFDCFGVNDQYDWYMKNCLTQDWWKKSMYDQLSVCLYFDVFLWNLVFFYHSNDSNSDY